MFALLCAAVIAGAAAGTPAARLEYTRAAEASACPDARAVRQAIAARLGYDPFRDEAPLIITVEVSKGEPGLRASIRLTDANGLALGARDLASTADDCAELAASLSLALSMAIDPLDRGRTAGEPFELSYPKRPVKPAPAPPPPSASVTPPAPDAWPAAWLISAGPVGSWAVAPSLSLGLAVEARARWSRGSVGLEVRADLPTQAPLLTGRVSSALFAGALEGCAHFGPVAACGVFAAGALRTSSSDFADSRTVLSPHVAAGLRAAVEIPIAGRWSVRATADGQVRLVRITLLVNDSPGWVSPPVFASLGFWAVAKIP